MKERLNCQLIVFLQITESNCIVMYMSLFIWQVIIFLNDADENAETVIGDSRIKPEKYKGICFGYENHHMIFPKSGVRYVLVATYI